MRLNHSLLRSGFILIYKIRTSISNYIMLDLINPISTKKLARDLIPYQGVGLTTKTQINIPKRDFVSILVGLNNKSKLREVSSTYMIQVAYPQIMSFSKTKLIILASNFVVENTQT